MKLPPRLRSLFALLALSLFGTPVALAGSSPPRECLVQAGEAADAIRLPGDRSAALRSAALVWVSLDPQSARNAVAGMRRPSDAARSLGAIAAAIAAESPEEALADAQTAARLLLRIADPHQRRMEQRLLLQTVSPLGERALEIELRLPDEEAKLLIVTSLAASDPEAAEQLLATWELQGAARDRSLAAMAIGVAGEEIDRALELVGGVDSAAIRDDALWAIAVRRPPGEAVNIAQRVADPIIRSAIQATAAVELSGENLDAALLAAAQVSVAPDSVRAQIAAAIARVDAAKAVEVARSLSSRARNWALGRIAVEVAATRPAEAERLLTESGTDPGAARLAAARMAAIDPDRALRIAQSIPHDAEREAALAAVEAALAGADPGRAGALMEKVSSPRWRARAIEPAVLAAAQVDHDAATSLIGYVAEPSLAGHLRAKVAARIAVRDPDTALRLLDSLPPSDYRTASALEAGIALLSAGDAPETALRLASIGLDPDLALRWMLPTLADSQTRSPINVAGEIGSSYLRAMALADVAGAMLGPGSRCRSVPERGRQVRPIVEWEGA